jgi:hypothetical protein
MISEPPLLKDPNANVIDPFAGVAETMTGLLGTVYGTTATDAADAAELPDEFLAINLYTWDVPLINPLTSKVVLVLPVET